MSGEMVEGNGTPVLNEKEIRASAGILFLFLIVSFMFAILEIIQLK
jgi:hypothetical protein